MGAGRCRRGFMIRQLPLTAHSGSRAGRAMERVSFGRAKIADGSGITAPQKRREDRAMNNERGRKNGKRKRQGIVPSMAPKRKNYPAIRQLTSLIATEAEIGVDFEDTDALQMYAIQRAAARESTELLREHEAQSKRLERAEELLSQVGNSRDELWTAATTSCSSGSKRFSASRGAKMKTLNRVQSVCTCG